MPDPLGGPAARERVQWLPSVAARRAQRHLGGAPQAAHDQQFPAAAAQAEETATAT
jgi:hypothetical protein